MEFANSTARLNIAVLLKVLMKKLKYYACKFSHLQVKSSNLMSTYVFRPIYLAQLKSWAIDKFTDTHLKKYHVNSNQNNKRKVHVQHNTLFLKTALCLVKCIPKLSPGNVQNIWRNLWNILGNHIWIWYFLHWKSWHSQDKDLMSMT